MLYRQFKDKKISLLGMGCMRLPVRDEKPDINETAEMVEYAINNGVNYFDTAWGYHGGESEKVIGKVLAKYPRNSYFLATKFPGYDLGNMGKVEEIFNTQLERTGAEYFDFYLIHNVCEMNIDEYLNPVHGTLPFLLKQKKAGKIKHLGFSAHGSVPVMKRFLEMYGEYMEFCQIQLNWIDIKFQKADEKMKLLKELNIPVWVMEPLRGGKLAGNINLPQAFAEKYPDFSPVKQSYRFLKSFPEIKVVLSGASSLEQMKENVALFSEEDPLSEEEMSDLIALGKTLTAGVPCTACRYCVSSCSMGIDIPEIISMYNEHKFTGGGFLAPMKLQSIPEEHRPSGCIACGKCRELCPQNINIPEIMSDFTNIVGK